RRARQRDAVGMAPAGRLGRLARPRLLALRADQPRAGLRVRGLRAHDRRPRQEPAPQDRARPQPAQLRGDRARRRLPPGGDGALMMSRLGVGARVTIAMTMIAVAAVLLTVTLASRSVDTSLDVFAAQRAQQRVQVA